MPTLNTGTFTSENLDTTCPRGVFSIESHSSHVKPAAAKGLVYLVFEESLLVFQNLVLLHESLVLYLSPPPVLSVVQWEIPLRPLQTHIAHFLPFKFQDKLYILIFCLYGLYSLHKLSKDQVCQETCFIKEFILMRYNI